MLVIDRCNGEIRQTHTFVAVLGGSSYTFAEAAWPQKLPDWLCSHVRTLLRLSWRYIADTVPDNLRSGVINPHRYEPDINPSYRDLAEHLGIAVLPARARQPRTKTRSKSVCKWTARDSGGPAQPSVLLHARTQHSHCAAAVMPQSEALQEAARLTPFGLRGHRPLQPLPQHPYICAELKKVRVHIDYHVEVDGHYYSVPYQLIKHQLVVRLTAKTVSASDKPCACRA